MTPTPAGKRRRTQKFVKEESKSSAIPDRWKIHHEIAFLGPEGTYGQQAAKLFAEQQSLPKDLEWVPCPTITDAYKRLSKYTVLPLENTIYGPVNETLDCLFTALDTLDTLESDVQQEENDDKPFTESKTIVAALDLPISHCLVVRKGTHANEIKWVRSHEQALGQSSKFLDRFLPNAKRIPTASTALAAQSLFTESETGAALCSRSVVDSNPDLEIMHEGTQDQEDNYTRFILLVDPMAADRMYPPDAKPKVEGRYYSHFYVGPPAAIAASVPNLGIKDDQYLITSVHSRPYRPTTHNPQSHHERYPQCVFWEVVSDNAEIPDTGDPDYWIGSAPTSVGPPRGFCG